MQKQDIFRKEYLKDSLLDDAVTVSRRIEMINNFDYKNYPALAKTNIFTKDDTVFYEQEKFSIVKKRQYKKEEFFTVADALEYFSTIDFIHGDINRKNILHTYDGFRIVDYEPSLSRLINGKRKLLITIPYVYREDLESKIITVATDKIGFFYFVLRVNRYFSSYNLVRLSKTLDHSIFFKRNIASMNYKEILKYAFYYIERQ